jgi:hypothetical protein
MDDRPAAAPDRDPRDALTIARASQDTPFALDLAGAHESEPGQLPIPIASISAPIFKVEPTTGGLSVLLPLAQSGTHSLVIRRAAATLMCSRAKSEPSQCA